MKKWLSGLEPRDRTMLLVSIGCATLLIVVVAVFAPQADDNNPTPSSYSTGSRGAEAAYLLLQHSGYRAERWTRPFAELPSEADTHTTVIIAEPNFTELREAQEPLRQILARGSRVLLTGLTGGFLAPDGQPQPNPLPFQEQCSARANGFSRLAASGRIRLRVEAFWKEAIPTQRAAYHCYGRAVVISYPYAKGRIIWWASSMPLENASIQTDDNLALLLNSVGTPAERRVIWDESLHGARPSLWSYTEHTPLFLVWWQMAGVAALLLFSYGRRSGPLRPDPVVSRTAPLEFVRSLGSLYHKAGATNIPVSVAYQRFRHMLERETGIGREHSTSEAADLILSRFSGEMPGLKAHMQAAADAAYQQPLSERKALALVQALQTDEHKLRMQMQSPGQNEANNGNQQPKTSNRNQRP